MFLNRFLPSRLLVLFVALLTSLYAPVAQSDDQVSDDRVPGSLSRQIQVNTSTEGSQLEPDVTHLSNGGWVVAWQDLVDFGVDRKNLVRARVFDRNSRPVGEDFQVNTLNGGSSSDAAVASTEDGFIVVWATAQGFPDSFVALQRYDNDGLAIGGEVQVSTTYGSYKAQPSIAIAPDGSFTVAWINLGVGIYAQRFTSDVVPVGSELELDTVGFPAQIQNPVIAAGEDGNVLVIWGHTARGLYGRLINESGQASDLIFYDIYPHWLQEPTGLQPRPGGGFIATWFALRNPDVAILNDFYSIDSNGLPSGSPGELGQSDWVFKDIDLGADGVAAVGRFQNNLFLRSFDADLLPVGERVMLHAPTFDAQRDPALSIGPNGDIVTVWQSEGSLGDDVDGPSIQMLRFRPTNAKR